MAQHQDMWPVAVLCEVLAVSRSGFYTYMQRQAAPTIKRDEWAELARVKAIAAETGYSYGSRRMAKQLQAAGFAVGRYKARQLMRQAGIVVRRRTRRRPIPTESRHGYDVAPNLLARQFDVDQPDQVWAGDITYVWTAEGWLYVAVLVDLDARKVVGWAMSGHVEATLVQEALRMALGRRPPATGLLHHSDRGSQYACQAYQRLLADAGLRCSMSRKGDCLDNAVAERFFGSLKRERTAHCQYATRQEARDDVIDYIEMFYTHVIPLPEKGLPPYHFYRNYRTSPLANAGAPLPPLPQPPSRLSWRAPLHRNAPPPHRGVLRATTALAATGRPAHEGRRGSQGHRRPARGGRCLTAPRWRASSLSRAQLERSMALLRGRTGAGLVSAALAYRLRQAPQRQPKPLPEQTGRPSPPPPARWGATSVSGSRDDWASESTPWWCPSMTSTHFLLKLLGASYERL
jgi:putative transposase